MARDIIHTNDTYRAATEDVTQEMERNKATAKHVVWPSCAWLLLSSFHFLWAIHPISPVEREREREREREKGERERESKRNG